MPENAGAAAGFALRNRLRRFSVFLAFAYAFASMGLCVWVFGSGLTSQEVYLEPFDAKGYFSLGSQIYGAEAIDGSRLAQRGFLYSSVAWPVLSLHPLLLFSLQLVACAVGVLALARSEALLTGRIYVTPLLLLFPSALIAPARMMTEAFAFAILTVSILLLLCGARRASVAVPLIWVGALVKPAILLPALLITIVVWLSGRMDWKLSALGGMLVAVQLVLSAVHDGKPALSTSGVENFAERFHPAVIGWSNIGEFLPYTSAEAKAYRKASPSLGLKLVDLAERPLPTIKAWSWILFHEHLVSKTGYLEKSSDLVPAHVSGPLRDFSGWVNIAMLPVWVLGILGCLALVKVKSAFVSAASLVGPLCLVTAPLVYWQGDRVVFYALLTLLPFAAFALHRLFGGQLGDQPGGASSNPSN